MAYKKDNRERKGKWKWSDKYKLLQEFIKKERENIKPNSKHTK